MPLSIWKSNLTCLFYYYLFQASKDMSVLLHKPSRHQLQKQWTLHFTLITGNRIIEVFTFLTWRTGVIWTQTELNLLNRPIPKFLLRVLPNFGAVVSGLCPLVPSVPSAAAPSRSLTHSQQIGDLATCPWGQRQSEAPDTATRGPWAIKLPRRNG